MLDLSNKKCSFEEHKNIDAVDYCSECDIYICEKCKDYHRFLIENHHNKKLVNKENNEINNELCYENNHENKLEYFCKTHNKMCCIACVTKIKGSGKGQHSNCDICFIKDIKEEKKYILKQNLLYLDNKSLIDSLINKTKEAYKEISDKKEKLKCKIQKLFTKIRNEINNREDHLLNKVDQVFTKLFFNKNLNKYIDNIMAQINLSQNKGKNLLNEFDNNNDNNLINLINDCVKIEKNINEIKSIEEYYQKYLQNKRKIVDMQLKEEEINFLMNIKNLGNICTNAFLYKLENNFIELNHNRKYLILGEKDNIAKKIIEDNKFTLIKTENNLEIGKIYKWKISILNSKSKIIMVGISQGEANSNLSLNNINGWYLYCFNSTLYSGKPHNYKDKKTNMIKVNKDIIIIFNMNNGNLEFIIDDNNKIEAYRDIPVDMPLYPSILLYDKNDSIEINECLI